ncbi:MAG TPA: GNAT family N-acetyltransferase [Flavobacterium sp.]|jgi:ribosomal protein S18 acetylase RimI-like enzyme|nr:GNAT family N-acetyltransferase [Flavobacterium sp.]HQX02537.1 GNAT family N-acetyltransferase [Flavobacterium sp.]HRZ32914.1 GNAT family N-acetyltransferase [Flavobacterium sp.]HRZ74300.1 GNAT family N-acetyltransferase [Flavobacterium sp.]
MTTYNPISISDIENIIQLMGEFYRIDNYPFDIEISRKLFNQFLTDENLGKAWLILYQNEIVGYVILTYVFSFEYQGKIAFLDELYIRENARGKGIGKETIAFIQQEAAKLSLKIIYLEVETHNDAAQKLYIANDFAIHKRKIMKYIVN